MTDRQFFKRGDTFKCSGEITVVINGSPEEDLTGYEGECQIRTPGDILIADLVFTWLDAVNRLAEISYAGSTQNWPLGLAHIDIQVTSPSDEVISTQTMVIEITRDVTR